MDHYEAVAEAAVIRLGVNPDAQRAVRTKGMMGAGCTLKNNQCDCGPHRRWTYEKLTTRRRERRAYKRTGFRSEITHP